MTNDNKTNEQLLEELKRLSKKNAELEKIIAETTSDISKEKELALMNVFENSTNLFYSHTADHILNYFSPQVKDFLGYTREEIMIKWTELASDNPTNEIAFNNTIRAIETGVPQPSYELELVKKNGELIMVEVREFPQVVDGKTIAILGSLTDITERKLAEEEKLKALQMIGEQKKQALVGEIAGKIAHDFNNILSIIMGNAELSLDDCKDPEIRKTLELIFEQTMRGRNLSRNLVAFAKDHEPKQVFFNISEKMDLVVNLMRKDLEGIELIREKSSNISELFADPGMIEHALINLIQNSIHAVSLCANPKITIRTFSSDNNIYCEIEDNGCGIPTKYLGNIYEQSFTLKGMKDVVGSYQSKINGTGYGMANVKKYVEQHNGSISVESELGLGTKFIISIPVIRKELTNEEKIEIRDGIVCFAKRILLVEDEVAILDIQRRTLMQDPCNHIIDIAHDAQSAIDLFEKNSYDLISLDYILSGKNNGMDVYNHIRKTDKTIPILFISGNMEFLESIRQLQQNDFRVEHLSKPCQNKDYVSSIDNLLKRALAPQT